MTRVADSTGFASAVGGLYGGGHKNAGETLAAYVGGVGIGLIGVDVGRCRDARTTVRHISR